MNFKLLLCVFVLFQSCESVGNFFGDFVLTVHKIGKIVFVNILAVFNPLCVCFAGNKIDKAVSYVKEVPLNVSNKLLKKYEAAKTFGSKTGEGIKDKFKAVGDGIVSFYDETVDKIEEGFVTRWRERVKTKFENFLASGKRIGLFIVGFFMI